MVRKKPVRKPVRKPARNIHPYVSYGESKTIGEKISWSTPETTSKFNRERMDGRKAAIVFFFWTALMLVIGFIVGGILW